MMEDVDNSKGEDSSKEKDAEEDDSQSMSIEVK